jgi:hypothetical protein
MLGGTMRGSRVFISCGQRVGSDEPSVAEHIARGLEQLGFVPYVAVAQQSLLAVRENIFPTLRDAEYFIFIDFKREVLESQTKEHRGSLFSHQELAIASFLEKEVIAFQETGVRRLDGLMAHLQTNALAFPDRAQLPDLVLAEVKRRGWHSDWRNELDIVLNDPLFDDARRGSIDGPLGRYYHLRVTNRHPTRVATDCYAFLYSAVREWDGQSEDFGTAEFKWAGTVLPAVRIGPLSHRVLDAFWLDHKHTLLPQFNCFADSTRFVPHLAGKGTWILTFGVVSDSLPATHRRFKLTITGSLETTVFAPLPEGAA